MSFGKQRGRWGINFHAAVSNLHSTPAASAGTGSCSVGHGQSSSTARSFDPPPAKQPGKGPYSNPLALLPNQMPGAAPGAGGLSGVNRSLCSLGKRRARDEDDYFNEEEEPQYADDLQYLPAPGSPSAQLRHRGSPKEHADHGQGHRLDDVESDGSDDPLEKFMNSIEAEVHALDRPKKEKDGQKGVRDDIEQEDEMEAYLRFMEENPNVGLTGEEDEIYEYDAEGNIIAAEKKAIDPLPVIDHSTINYSPFERNFYVEHPEISKLTQIQVDELRTKLGIRVTGLQAPRPVCAFAHFQFDEQMMGAIRKAGYTQPTPIQAQGIPAALAGRDLIGIAKTGSGKTAAYLWPLLVHIMDQTELRIGDGPIGLICAPTRELAQQIYSEARKFAKVYNVQVVCAYGGGSMYEQQQACETGCEILVCTPGRLIDLVKKKSTNLRRVTYLVFDEADKMFSLGFEPQVRSIANHVRPDRQTLMFSATFKSRVERLARDILIDPIRIVQGELGEANEDVTQIIEIVDTLEQKWAWLNKRLVQFTTEGSVLIFVTRKLHSEELAQKLTAHDFKVLLIHGDMHQADRNTVIQAFKRGDCPILIATDVAARGLDIPTIRTVVNYEVARDIDTHTHRIGRTGRAGHKGTAYTLLLRGKENDFAGHLVRNLEGANQLVPQALIELAMVNPWFNKTRFKSGGGKRLSGNLGVRSRPGLGCTSAGGTGSSGTPSFAAGSMAVGPQTDRISTMKAAFSAQYSRMFVSAGVAGGKLTSKSAPGSAGSSGSQQPERKKPSRWD